MSLLNSKLNETQAWENLKNLVKKRVEVDLQEVERVIEVARKTPGLTSHEPGLQKLSIFFAVATQYYQQEYPEGLVDLLGFWERYRAAVIQRYSAITPVELRAGDKVVTNVFNRFILRVPNENVVYDREARPLVYGGEGGLYGYFTHPPGWNRPFAIINLPHAAFDNCWHWMALPHETGHDLYAAVQGLDKELGNALGERMIKAVRDREVNIPAVHRDLSALGGPNISYTGEEFLKKLWQGWANESQADIVGLLNCGGAAIVSLQQIIGFDTKDQWLLSQDENGNIVDEPEPHPTGYIRNALNIAALRLIDNGSHQDLANEVEQRFTRLRPTEDEIVWYLNGKIEFARVSIRELVKSAEIAADVFCNHKLAVLGGKSYAELGTFTANEQEAVTAMIEPLSQGDPTFTQVMEGIEPRHALAATVFAFEKDFTKADIINKTFLHFV